MLARLGRLYVFKSCDFFTSETTAYLVVYAPKGCTTFHFSFPFKPLLLFWFSVIWWKIIGWWTIYSWQDFLRQNNTGKLLWQVFGVHAATLCLFGITEHEEKMWNVFKLEGLTSISLLVNIYFKWKLLMEFLCLLPLRFTIVSFQAILHFPVYGNYKLWWSTLHMLEKFTVLCIMLTCCHRFHILESLFIKLKCIIHSCCSPSINASFFLEVHVVSQWCFNNNYSFFGITIWHLFSF